MGHAVKVSQLSKVIKEKIIVDRISFTVEKGEVFGLLGANGSGKTTTFNMMSGLLAPSSGDVEVLGKSLRERKKSGGVPEVGMVTQQDSFYETLTVQENLEFFAGQFGIPEKVSRERISELLKQVKLTVKKDALASSLSGGMKKRLNMACSLVHDPIVVFLDEPTVGLDPVVRKEIWMLIKDLHKAGKTIIFTSHYMDEVEELCDKVAIMFAGRIVDSGTPEKLKKKHKLNQMEDVFAHLIKRGV
ncbi:ATP-binding cassette domain-containing protein [Candidatus Micrarchaeota archaeon]|nr:ATP-binding cassette domain-containing protein [Candidatus Micrarchaeota archaeon]MBD3418147.1 ATP-binding cassette domain-containing protein [Candidatus Micrarchaeota archaeon]